MGCSFFFNCGIPVRSGLYVSPAAGLGALLLAGCPHLHYECTQSILCQCHPTSTPLPCGDLDLCLLKAHAASVWSKLLNINKHTFFLLYYIQLCSGYRKHNFKRMHFYSMGLFLKLHNLNVNLNNFPSSEIWSF